MIYKTTETFQHVNEFIYMTRKTHYFLFIPIFSFHNVYEYANIYHAVVDLKVMDLD